MRIVRPWRMAGATAVLTAAALLLTGCFIIPLADDRSPFDDPFGPSRADVEEQQAPVQEAAQDALGDEWAAVAYTAADNCEGDCNLHLGLRIEPSATSAEPVQDENVPLPTETLRALLQAVVPLAAEARLDVTIDAACSGITTLGCTDFTAAVAEVTGFTDDRERDDDFSLRRHELTVLTGERTAEQILARAG